MNDETPVLVQTIYRWNSDLVISLRAHGGSDGVRGYCKFKHQKETHWWYTFDKKTDRSNNWKRTPSNKPATVPCVRKMAALKTGGCDPWGYRRIVRCFFPFASFVCLIRRSMKLVFVNRARTSNQAHLAKTFIANRVQLTEDINSCRFVTRYSQLVEDFEVQDRQSKPYNNFDKWFHSNNKEENQKESLSGLISVYHQGKAKQLG